MPTWIAAALMITALDVVLLACYWRMIMGNIFSCREKIYCT